MRDQNSSGSLPNLEGSDALSPSSGWVYLLRGTVTRRVKIGFTARNEVPLRVSEIAGQISESVELLGAIPGTQELERTLHRRFHRCRVVGEWFELTDDELRVLLDPPARAYVKDWEKRRRDRIQAGAEQARAASEREWAERRLQELRRQVLSEINIRRNHASGYLAGFYRERLKELQQQGILRRLRNRSRLRDARETLTRMNEDHERWRGREKELDRIEASLPERIAEPRPGEFDDHYEHFAQVAAEIAFFLPSEATIDKQVRQPFVCGTPFVNRDCDDLVIGNLK